MNEKNVNKELFEKMPVPSAATKLMLPTIAGSLVMVLYSLADTFFVGMLADPIQNAAVSLASPLLIAFYAVNNLFGVGSSSMMSRALGRKDYEAVRRGSAFGLYCAFFFAALYSLIGMFFSGKIILFLGADSETFAATSAYVKWTVICGAIPSIMNMVFACMVRSEGESLNASIGTMSGCVINIILDPLFILPSGLGMGAAGAGLATFISNCCALLYFLVLLYIRRKRTFVTLSLRYFSFKKEIVADICGVGIPAAVQNILNVAGMTVLNNFAAGYGPDVIAAMGIAHRIYQVPIQVALGGTQGMIPLVSYSYSSKNNTRFKDVILFVAKVLLPSIFIVAGICWVLAPNLASLFINKESVVHYASIFLRQRCFAMPFLVCDFLVIGVVQAIGRGNVSLVFAFLRKLVFEIPASVVLNKLFFAEGLAGGAFVAESMMAIIGSCVLFKIIKELPKTLPKCTDASVGCNE